MTDNRFAALDAAFDEDQAHDSLRPSYVYVASSWRNSVQQAVVATLRAASIDCYDFRNPPGGTGFSWREVRPDYDGPRQHGEIRAKGADWEPVDTYLDMVNHPRAVEGYAADFAAMERADTFVMVLPCGKSAHLEIGYAIGAGKRTAILLEDPVEPELLLVGIAVAIDDELAKPSYEIDPWTPRDMARIALDVVEEHMRADRETAYAAGVADALIASSPRLRHDEPVTLTDDLTPEALDALSALLAQMPKGPFEVYENMHAEAAVTEAGRGGFGVVALPATGREDYGRSYIVAITALLNAAPALILSARLRHDEPVTLTDDEREYGAQADDLPPAKWVYSTEAVERILSARLRPVTTDDTDGRRP